MTVSEAFAEVRRRFKASPARVFAAFGDAGLVGRWLSPSPEITLAVLAFDFRVGGAYRFAYHVPEGGTVIVAGVYRLIEPPTKIVFSWVIEPPDEHAGIDSEVTVTITADGPGAELLIRHQKLRRTDAVTRHATGWQGALDQLAALFETPGSTERRCMTAVDDLAANVRAALADVASISEVTMFGGIGFMLNGNLIAAASKRGLLVRIGKAHQPDALLRPGARPMEMRGRLMDGYVYVDPPALTDTVTREWLQLALAFAQTLPPKPSGSKPARKKGRPA